MPINDILRERILRRLDALPEAKQYMVLDYVEFLESKYAEHTPTAPNVFQRLMEGVEDTLRAGNVSAGTVAQAMGFMSQAMGVLQGVAAAGKSVVEDVTGGARPATGSTTGAPPAAPSATPPAPTPPSGTP